VGRVINQPQWRLSEGDLGFNSSFGRAKLGWEHPVVSGSAAEKTAKPQTKLCLNMPFIKY